MLEGVQYNTHCDWLIVWAIFPYYMYAYGFVQVMFPNAWSPGKRQTENVTMSHNYCFSLAQDCIWKLWPLIIVVQPRNRLWAFRLLLSPLCVMCKTTSGKNGCTKPWIKKHMKECFSPSGMISHGHFFSRFFTVTLSDVQY